MNRARQSLPTQKPFKSKGTHKSVTNSGHKSPVPEFLERGEREPGPSHASPSSTKRLAWGCRPASFRVRVCFSGP